MLLLEMAGRIREKLVEDGWTREGSLLTRTRLHGQQRKMIAAATALGITEDHVDALRVTSQVQASKSRVAAVAARPDQALLESVKPWVTPLSAGASFHGNDRYVDTMGAVHYRMPQAHSLIVIAEAWISLLLQHGQISRFDCVLTHKNGNPILVHDFCARFSPSGSIQPLLCKSGNDRSRVHHGAGYHATDFEGLTAFLAQNPWKPGDRRFRVLALDDNATTGNSLLAAVKEFNDFATSSAGAAFEPISEAVLLYVVKAPGQPWAFSGQQLRVHAMIALGAEEMKRIERASPKKVPALADEMKDHEACEFSRTLPTLTR